jgi:non-ribosomal peptide synthase protein (TIGR01720 family)
MMDGAVGPFVEAVGRVELSSPGVPYASNVTGGWVEGDDVRDPAYWGRHIRQPVLFGPGMEELLSDTELALLEVGPGRVLAALAMQQESIGADRLIVSSLGRAGTGEPADRAAAAALGALWAGGVEVDWAALHAGTRRRRVTLPTYPFQHERYWIDAPAGATRQAGARRMDVGEWFYRVAWRRSRPGRAPEARGDRVVVLGAEARAAAPLLAGLREAGREVIEVRAGARFESSDRGFAVDPGSDADLDRLVEALRTTDGLPASYVHTWTLEEDGARDPGLGVEALLRLARALERAPEPPGAPRIDVITAHLHDVTGRERIRPEGATVLGFCRTAPLELPGLTCRNLDLALDDAGGIPAADLPGVLRDLSGETPGAIVAHRDGARWLQSFVRAELDPVPGGISSRLREGGAYLVTGGMGGMGLALAGELARCVRARLVLVGRTPLPARETWDRELESRASDDPVAERIGAILAMEEAGAEVLTAAVDVCDEAAMRELVEGARERFGPIRGVMHMAGVPGAGESGRAEAEDVAATLAPKLGGARVLESVLDPDELDFLVLGSSLMASWPAPGWTDYCAANSALDAFARAYGDRTGVFTASIEWPRWRDSGMAVDMARRAGQVSPAEGLSNAEGIEVFHRVLEWSDDSQVLVSATDFREPVAPAARSRPAGSASAGDEQVAGTSGGHARPELSTEYVAPRSEVEERLSTVWASLFGLESVGVLDNFFELGGDSVLGIQIVARARQAGLALSPTSLYEHPTVAELAEVLGDAPAAGPSAEVEQGTITGPVELGPVQRWFLEAERIDAHHFNQTQLVPVEQPLDAEAWERVLDRLLRHHDALRLRFERGAQGWTQRCAEPDASVPLVFERLAELDEAAQRERIEELASSLQTTLDLEHGPLARFAVLDLGGGRQLLLAILHHIAVDAVSWPVLGEDIARLAEQAAGGSDLELPPKTTSFQAWTAGLAEHARSTAAATDAWCAGDWEGVSALPLDRPGGENTYGASRRLDVSLDEERTAKLLKVVTRSGAQVPDALVAALVRAVGGWSGSRSVLLDVEGHGREELFGPVDLTRTVGWFTSIYPVVTAVDSLPAGRSAIRAVRERLSSLPENGMSFGVLRYMSDDASTRERLAALPHPEISFLYLGNRGAAAGGGDGGEPLHLGDEVSPRMERTHVLDVMSSVEDRRLHMTWIYSGGLHDEATIEELSRRFEEQLEALWSEPSRRAPEAPNGRATRENATPALASAAPEPAGWERGGSLWAAVARLFRGRTRDTDAPEGRDTTNEDASGAFPHAGLDDEGMRRVRAMLEKTERNG